MLILGLDCGGTESRVAVWRGNLMLAELSEPADRGKGDRYVPLIDQAVQQAGVHIKDINLIAVCSGPGSFTGIRIGIAAAQGLAFALGSNVIGIDAFTLCHFAARDEKSIVAVVVESKRDELYVQIYDASGTVILAAQSMTVPDIKAQLANYSDVVIVTGDAASKIFDYPAESGNSASLLCRFAATLPSDCYPQFMAEPLYIRPADVSFPKKTN